MPIGDLNSAPKFVAMIMKLKLEWDTLAKERVLKNVAYKNIVDDLLLYGRTSENLLDYSRTVLDALTHHHVTLKLKNCKWFQDMCKFVGMDVAARVTQPA